MTTIVSIKPLYLSREETAKFLAISTTTLESMVAKGQAPKPRKVSPNRVGWLVEELETWGRARPESDLAPPPGSGYGSAGKPESAGARPSR